MTERQLLATSVWTLIVASGLVAWNAQYTRKHILVLEDALSRSHAALTQLQNADTVRGSKDEVRWNRLLALVRDVGSTSNHKDRLLNTIKSGLGKHVDAVVPNVTRLAAEIGAAAEALIIARQVRAESEAGVDKIVADVRRYVRNLFVKELPVGSF
jgi:hypothetical protein